MPGVVAVYHSGGDDLGLASLQQFAMMPETLNRPIFATGKVRFVGDIIAAVVAETRAAGGRRGRDASSSTTTRCRRSRARSTRWRPTRRCCSPTTGRTCASPTLSRGRRRRPARRRGRRRRGHDGEPASRGRSDGDQRHPRGAGRRRPHVLDLASGAALIAGGVRPNARAGTGQAARRVPVGRGRFRSEGGAVCRAPRDRRGGAAARTTR